METLGKIAIVLAILAFIAGCFWFNASAPCSWQTWRPAKDVPARCLNISK